MSDRIFLKVFSSYNELGIYSAGLKIMAIMTIIQTIFVNYWVPVSYRWLSEGKDMEVFQKVSEIVNLILSNIVFIMTIVGPILILFVSKDYKDVQYFFPLLVVPVYLSCLSETSNLGIVFSRKTYINIYISAITLLVNILLSFILIPRFEGRGAALSNALSFIIFFVLRSVFSSKNGFNIKISKHLITLAMLLVICISKAFFNIEWYYCLVLYIPYLAYSLIKLWPYIKMYRSQHS
jgi:O-antigen/teichoic acid export membrane protein